LGFILALILAVALALFAAANARNSLSLELVAGWRVTGVPVWMLIAGTGLTCAVVAWICGLRSSLHLKRELRKRDREIKEAQRRLDKAHDALQEYETRMHEFALKVVQMAHRQLPPGPGEAAEELLESSPLATFVGDEGAPAARPEPSAPRGPQPQPSTDEDQPSQSDDDAAPPKDDEDYI
jgi:uncharacterized integral membrane protein